MTSYSRIVTSTRRWPIRAQAVELTFDEVRRLSGWATCGLTPDLTVLLDIPAAVGLERARGRAESTDGRRYTDEA